MSYRVNFKLDVNIFSAIRSSRSDSVTEFVRPFICSSVRVPFFLILKFSCSLMLTMSSKLLTIVLGVKLHVINITKALKFQFEAEN